MIVPAVEQPILSVFRCPVCDKVWARYGQSRSFCAVLHPPGSCCHHDEVEPRADSVLYVDGGSVLTLFGPDVSALIYTRFPLAASAPSTVGGRNG